MAVCFCCKVQAGLWKEIGAPSVRSDSKRGAAGCAWDETFDVISGGPRTDSTKCDHDVEVMNVVIEFLINLPSLSLASVYVGAVVRCISPGIMGVGGVVCVSSVVCDGEW